MPQPLPTQQDPLLTDPNFQVRLEVLLPQVRLQRKRLCQEKNHDLISGESAKSVVRDPRFGSATAC